MSEHLDLYEFKIALFDNSKDKEFLLFIWNLNRTINASRMLMSGEKIQ